MLAKPPTPAPWGTAAVTFFVSVALPVEDVNATLGNATIGQGNGRRAGQAIDIQCSASPGFRQNSVTRGLSIIDLRLRWPLTLTSNQDGKPDQTHLDPIFYTVFPA